MHACDACTGAGAGGLIPGQSVSQSVLGKKEEGKVGWKNLVG